MVAVGHEGRCLRFIARRSGSGEPSKVKVPTFFLEASSVAGAVCVCVKGIHDKGGGGLFGKGGGITDCMWILYKYFRPGWA